MAMPRKVLMPLPGRGFDPTETGAPWKALTDAGVEVVFATPKGRACDVPEADPWMLEEGAVTLGAFGPLLIADANGRAAYRAMAASARFQDPIAYDEIEPADFAGLVLPGGHARPMRTYLDSATLQAKVSEFFERQMPIGAICHGVLLAARCRRADGRSVLDGYRTTALTRQMELLAWDLTKGIPWVGDYYRTYPATTVEEEVTAALGPSGRFHTGPQLPAGLAVPALANIGALFANAGFLDLFKAGFLRDNPGWDVPAFTVCHADHYLSARWPGDAFTFAKRFLALLDTRRCDPAWTSSAS
jgi:protease I